MNLQEDVKEVIKQQNTVVSGSENQQPSKKEDKNEIMVEEDLRQTWKSKPKISSKLPSAFSNVNKSQHVKKKGEIVKNSNDAQKLKIKNQFESVEAEEYKAVQNLLSPIKLNQDKKKEIAQNLNKLDQDFPIIFNPPSKSNVLKPLNPKKGNVEKGFQNQEVNSKSQLPNLSEGIPFKALTQSQVRLEDMITLATLKGNRSTGAVKKLLHAPTLKLFVVKEIPTSNRDARLTLKDWIATWQTYLSNSIYAINIYGTFFNTPEGCVSIIMDYMNAGSLENLLDSVGALPEIALKEIAKQLLMGLEDIHSKCNSGHGSIIPTQVLMDQNGQIKINLGFGLHINPSIKDQHQQLICDQPALSLFENNANNSPSRIKKNNNA